MDVAAVHEREYGCCTRCPSALMCCVVGSRTAVLGSAVRCCNTTTQMDKKEIEVPPTQQVQRCVQGGVGKPVAEGRGGHAFDGQLCARMAHPRRARTSSGSEQSLYFGSGFCLQYLQTDQVPGKQISSRRSCKMTPEQAAALPTTRL